MGGSVISQPSYGGRGEKKLGSLFITRRPLPLLLLLQHDTNSGINSCYCTITVAPSCLPACMHACFQGIWPPNSDGSEINAVDLCPGDQNLLVVGDDFNMVKLFRYPCLLPSSQAKEYRGHAAEVQNVRFNFNGELVFSVGGLDKAVLQFILKKSARKDQRE
mgnify:CR=1 FL=1